MTSPNIAVIKYWGKFQEGLILPLNTSLGVTLDNSDLNTITKVTLSDKYKHHQLVLNGHNTEITNRIKGIIDFFTEKALKNILSLEIVKEGKVATLE